MTCSASASRSPVLTPGRAAAVMAVRACATRAPATRMASISPAVLSSTSRPRQRASTARTPPRVPLLTWSPRGQRVHEPLGDLVQLADTVDAHELGAVVVEQRSGLVAVDLLPVADHVFGVVAATAAQ